MHHFEVTGRLKFEVCGSQKHLSTILMSYINSLVLSLCWHIGLVLYTFTRSIDKRFETIISVSAYFLSHIQAEMRDTIGPSVLYAIQPISKKTAKDTLTLMNLRKSKKKQNKHMTAPLFQVWYRP